MAPSVTLRQKVTGEKPHMRGDFEPRPSPYPYQAMMAICSDLDETPDRDAYWRIMRFLNTLEETEMGPGAGLEVGNSIYFDMPSDQFSYWNTDDRGREMVRTLIRSGHVDCLHSFGDHATTRDHARRALDEFARNDCRIEVWIDHAVAPTNFGADIMCGHGDETGHPAYHADLTVDFGVRYVWRGRVTSVVGQGGPARLGGIWDASRPAASARTLGKEIVKQVLGRVGIRKYGLHVGNPVLRPLTLRDGTMVHEFLRSNPHWGGVSSCETGRGIGQVLTESLLDRLISRQGVCLLYTHLGKVDDPDRPFDVNAVAGFRRLADAHAAGNILVTTTRRVLRFWHMIDTISWDATMDGDTLVIDVGGPEDLLSDPSGLTFYVPGTREVRLRVGGRDIENLVRNEPDHTGRWSVSVPWRRLEFPSF